MPRLEARIVVDLYPDKGALGGIYTGLVAANTFYSLVVACDMPFLNPSLLSYLISLAPDFDLVVPRVGDLMEPLHTIYSKNCLAPIRQLLNKDRLMVAKLFAVVKTRYVDEAELVRYDPELLSFFNINTETDLNKAKTLISEKEKVHK